MADLPDRVKQFLPDEVLDELLAGAQGEQEIVGPGGLLSQLTKRLVERAMEVELTDPLGYEPHAEPPGGAGNEGRAKRLAKLRPIGPGERSVGDSIQVGRGDSVTCPPAVTVRSA